MPWRWTGAAGDPQQHLRTNHVREGTTTQPLNGIDEATVAIEGGVIEGGVIEGGAIEGDVIEGVAIEGGVIQGGVIPFHVPPIVPVCSIMALVAAWTTPVSKGICAPHNATHNATRTSQCGSHKHNKGRGGGPHRAEGHKTIQA
jgi:hypothetical protein